MTDVFFMNSECPNIYLPRKINRSHGIFCFIKNPTAHCDGQAAKKLIGASTCCQKSMGAAAPAAPAVTRALQAFRNSKLGKL